MIIHAIKELLTKHDCVVLPGFGAFIAHNHTAEVHPVKHLSFPPSRKVVFNSALTKNDGLLFNYLKRKTNDSEEEVKRKVDTLITKIKSDLRKVNFFYVEGIGSFTIGEEDKLIFQSTDQDNLLLESFGLPQLYFKPLEKPKMETTEHQQNHEETVETVKNKNKLFVILPIILLLIGGGAGGFLWNKNHKSAVQEASLIESSDSIVESTEEVVDEYMSTESEEYTSNDSFSNTEEVVHESSEPKAKKHIDRSAVEGSFEGDFHIIAGVFSTQENAEKFIENHAGAVVLHVDGMYKVSVASYASGREAYNKLSGFQSQFGPDVWIMKK